MMHPTAGISERPRRPGGPDLVVLILAKDEALVLPATLHAVFDQIGPGCEVHVVADGCRDDTAKVARASAARVFERPARGPLGKGAALAWWLRRTHAHAPGTQIIVVLDADSRMFPGCLDALRMEIEQGSVAAQAQIVPAVESTSPIAALAALSEIADQVVGDAIRVRLRWPVRLRGTGMAFRRLTLEAFAPQLSTSIEDAELTVLMASRGLVPRWIRGARIEDPKPNSTQYAARQRARWLKGQLQLLAAQPRAVLATLGRGLPGWSLAASVFLRPKAFSLPLFALAAMLSWKASSGSLWYLLPALFFGAWTFVGAASMMVGLAWSPAFGRTLGALLLLPSYVVLWLISAGLALSTGDAWPRARPLDTPTRPAGEPGHAL